jgi:membrane protease YdiL (CAAX protease family)
MSDAAAVVVLAPTPERARQLGPLTALFFIIAFYCIQHATGYVVGLVGGWVFLEAAIRNRADLPSLAEMQRALIMPAAILAELAAGGTVFVATRRLLGSRLSSLGWCRAKRDAVAPAALVGAALALFYLRVLHPMWWRSSAHYTGPVTSVVERGGWPRHLWVLLVVLLAPPVEEFVFRGMMYGGLRRVLSPFSAGAIVTAAFLFGHRSEIRFHGSAAASLVLLGIATLATRTRTRSLVPSIVLHTAYNSIIAISLYAA